MKDFIDKLIEKLYYRRFPDRVNDHAIATAPLPIIREERYTPRTIKVVDSIPEVVLDSLPDKEEKLKDMMFQKMKPFISPHIVITTIKSGDPLSVRVIGEFQIFERRTSFVLSEDAEA